MSRIICALPLPVALGLGRLCGWLWYYFIPIRRAVARDNLRRALGEELTAREQRRILRQCFTHWSLYAIELLRAPLMTRELSDLLVEREGLERFDEALARGTGCIGVIGHVGSLDLAGFSQAARGLPLAVVVRKIKWKPARDFVNGVRKTTGLELLPAKKGREACLQAIADNKVLTLVADQHFPAHRAIVASFFGRLAATTPAPVRYALETGAPLFPAVIRRKGFSGRHHLCICPAMELETPFDDPEANVRHNTERLNRVFEEFIRQSPEQWLWLHKRWKVEGEIARYPERWQVPPELSHLRSD